MAVGGALVVGKGAEEMVPWEEARERAEEATTSDQTETPTETPENTNDIDPEKVEILDIKRQVYNNGDSDVYVTVKNRDNRPYKVWVRGYLKIDYSEESEIARPYEIWEQSTAPGEIETIEVKFDTQDIVNDPSQVGEFVPRKKKLCDKKWFGGDCETQEL